MTPFGGMKLLKDFIDTTNIIEGLRSVNLPYLQSNAGIDPIDIIQGFCTAATKVSFSNRCKIIDNRFRFISYY